MSEPKDRIPRELEQLTTSIREMASRVSAEFVIDQRKSENYLAASHRQRSSTVSSRD